MSGPIALLLKAVARNTPESMKVGVEGRLVGPYCWVLLFTTEGCWGRVGPHTRLLDGDRMSQLVGVFGGTVNGYGFFA